MDHFTLPDPRVDLHVTGVPAAWARLGEARLRRCGRVTPLDEIAMAADTSSTPVFISLTRTDAAAPGRATRDVS